VLIAGFRFPAHGQWDSDGKGRLQNVVATETFVTSAVDRNPIYREEERTTALSNNLEIIELDCRQVRREMVDYMEGDLTPFLRAQIEWHLENCRHCVALYSGTRNIVQLLGNREAIELPIGFSRRLHQRLFC
jgi:hypothetical protein